MKKNPLANKTALITGAARRIGAEIATELHDAGMNIILHYHLSQDAAQALCEKFNQKRPQSAVIICQALEEFESEKMLIQKAIKVWNRLDVLVNNASRFYRTPFGETTEFAWNDLFGANLKAPFFLCQAAAPHLAEHKGSIVNITDIHGVAPLRDYAVYGVSKGALTIMTAALAKELGARGVRVNGVAPGAIIWPEGENTLSEREKEAIIKKIPLNKAGHPKDIAKAVLFFVRDAEYVTGQVLSVDGGRSL